MKKLIRIITAASVLSNMLVVPVFAEETVSADKYTVGKGYILGVEEGCTAADFLSAIKCPTGSYVQKKDSTDTQTGALQNGDVLNAGDEAYTIYTTAYDRTYYINDDFSDGTKGSWGGGTAEMTDKYGYALTFSGAAATATAYRYFDRDKDNKFIAFDTNAKFWVEELKLCLPEKNSSTVGIIVQNNQSNRDYLSVLRFMNFGSYGLHTLNPPSTGGYTTLSTNIQNGSDKWYDIKNITSTTTGYMSTYLDGNPLKENYPTQTTDKTKSRVYVPFQVQLSAPASTGTSLQLAEYKMYSEEPIRVNKLEYSHGGTVSSDMRSVPTDIPDIKVYFSTDGVAIDSASVLSGVKLYDSADNEIPALISYDAEAKCCTLTPQQLFAGSTEYKVKISGVKESDYGSTLSAEYAFVTDAEAVSSALLSAEAEADGESFSDISAIKKNTKEITLKFVTQPGVQLVDTSIDGCFTVLDEDGNVVEYEGSWDSTASAYTFTFADNCFTSGKNYKILVQSLANTKDSTVIEKTINMRAVGKTLIDTEEYTVGDGFIMGVSEGTSVDAFLSKLICLGTPVLYAGSSENTRTDKVQNGDTLVVSGKKYVIETDAFEHDTILLDTFEDGTVGKWTVVSGSGLKVTEDAERGKVLSIQNDDASSANKKSATYKRDIGTISSLPDTLIFEYDIKFPVYNCTGNWAGVVMKNSADKFLATLRNFSGSMKALYTGSDGYQEIEKAAAANKWHNIKYVMDTKTGYADIYLNDELKIKDHSMQAIKNSPGNYTPTVLQLCTNNADTADISVSIDNVELYAPVPVKVGSITISKGEERLSVLEKAPVDLDEIKVKLACENTIDKETFSADNVYLADNSETKIPCTITASDSDFSYQLKPSGILKPNSTYKIVLSGVKDTSYKMAIDKTYTFTTDSKAVDAKVGAITAKAGSDTYDGVSKIRTDTDTVEVKLVLSSGTVLDADLIDSSIGIWDGDTEVTTAKSFKSAENTFIMELSDELTSGKVYTLRIKNLTDEDGKKILTAEYKMRAVAEWVVSAGDMLSSTVYTVSDGTVSGIVNGTTVTELWQGLKTIPGTEAEVYTDETLQTVNTGVIEAENVIKAYNSFADEAATYKLSLTGCTVESEYCNVADDTISGVKEGLSADDFMKKLTVYGAESYEITDKNGDAAAVITNGCRLKIKSGAKTYTYTINTINNESTIYYDCDFEEGNGGWSTGSTLTVDVEKGNVLSYIISGASSEAKKGASQTAALSVDPETEILVFETDIKVPTMPNSQMQIMTKNKAGKYLMVLRVSDKGVLYTLIPNKQANILDTIQENKWYNLKYVNNLKDGDVDIYLDGKLVLQDQKYQATDDFMPATLEISTGTTAVNGTVLSLDNFKLYEPNPIKLAYADTADGSRVNTDLTAVAPDTDKINVYFSIENGYELVGNPEECAALADKDGNIVPTVNSYDKTTGAITLAPKCVLDCDADYTVKVNGMTDDIYKKNVKCEVSLHTRSFGLNMLNSYLMTGNGDLAQNVAEGRMSVHVPFVNLGGQKSILFMLNLTDADGRLVACSLKELNAETAALSEIIFNFEITSDMQLPASATLLTREENGGPLALPFEAKLSDN